VAGLSCAAAAAAAVAAGAATRRIRFGLGPGRRRRVVCRRGPARCGTLLSGRRERRILRVERKRECQPTCSVASPVSRGGAARMMLGVCGRNWWLVGTWGDYLGRGVIDARLGEVESQPGLTVRRRGGPNRHGLEILRVVTRSSRHAGHS
jgi:hypothetical protein